MPHKMKNVGVARYKKITTNTSNESENELRDVSSASRSVMTKINAKEAIKIIFIKRISHKIFFVLYISAGRGMIINLANNNTIKVAHKLDIQANIKWTASNSPIMFVATQPHTTPTNMQQTYFNIKFCL